MLTNEYSCFSTILNTKSNHLQKSKVFLLSENLTKYSSVTSESNLLTDKPRNK